MANLIPVTLENCKDKFWQKPANFLFARSTYLIPVSLNEINHLLLFLPLLFIKDKNEKFRLVALLNLLPQGNLFVNEKGQWFGRYLPMYFAAYPFFLGFTEKKEPILLIDENFLLPAPQDSSSSASPDKNPDINPNNNPNNNSQGHPFFTEKGELTEELKQIAQFLLIRERGYEAVSNLCDQLAELDLFEPFPLTIKIGHEEKTLQGLYRINLEKYTNLEDEKVLSLRKSGAQIVIYGHLFSLLNLDFLISLLNLQASTAPDESTAQSAISAKPKSLAQATPKAKFRKKTSQAETITFDLESTLKELKFPGKS